MCEVGIYVLRVFQERGYCLVKGEEIEGLRTYKLCCGSIYREERREDFIRQIVMRTVYETAALQLNLHYLLAEQPLIWASGTIRKFKPGPNSIP